MTNAREEFEVWIREARIAVLREHVAKMFSEIEAVTGGASPITFTIREQLIEARRNFNRAMDQLALLDPSTPRFRYGGGPMAGGLA